jgi:peptide/nickel transport system substrate-binding protein
MAQAATRPRYGGNLRVAMSAAPTSLDPLDLDQSDSLQGNNLSALIFDTLVTLDGQGKLQPALATSWQPEPGSQRWQFTLRHGITFQDGTPVTADQIAAALRLANPRWTVLPAAGQIMIECDSPVPDLPAELAKARNGVAKRGGPNLLGTGPFSITQWQAGKKLILAANNSYWAGRPLLDSIEITMAQGFHEQAILFDLGKADLIEVSPEQAHRAFGEGRRTERSEPSELIALVFTTDHSTDQGILRTALALAVDRRALSNVLLQGGADPAGGLLPNWMSGYGFIFPTNADLASARQTRGAVRQATPWNLGYDANDPLARVVAERIVLNARDAGLIVQLVSSNNPDLRLVRIPILSLNPRTALMALADALHLSHPKDVGDSPQDLYATESMLLASHRVIPLLHLRTSYGMNAGVNGWAAAPNGKWDLSDVWLGTSK